MNLADFLNHLSNSPETISFDETMSTIESHYDFTPCKFTNGDTINDAGENNGSCKIFAFAQLNKLDKASTLHCFGNYYRKDVLENPDGDDHQNIRNFIRNGWDGIEFHGTALIEK